MADLVRRIPGQLREMIRGAMRRTLLSVFLGGHLTALVISATPNPDQLRRGEGARESGDDALAAQIRPTLDSAAGVLRAVDQSMWTFFAPVRGLALWYTERFGIGQTWNMFANPPTGEEYVRLRYYSLGSPGHLTVSTELVFPEAPATESRLVRSYWNGHRDKAISNAVIAYFSARTVLKDGRGVIVPVSDLEQNPVVVRAIRPVADYFADRYRRRLPVDRRLIRTEVWYGFAPARPRGDSDTSPVSRARVVGRYYHGIPDEPAAAAFHPIDTIEHEADLTWMLVYARMP